MRVAHPLCTASASKVGLDFTNVYGPMANSCSQQVRNQPGPTLKRFILKLEWSN
jgi:hypothetical protein